MRRKIKVREQQMYVDARYPLKIDDEYSFIREDVGYLVLSKIVYFFVIIFGRLFLNIFYTHKAIGKNKIDKLNGKGFISISNHCHFLDSVLTGTTLRKRTIWFSSMQRNFEIPYVRHILRILKVFPIPKSPLGLMQILKPVEKALEEANVIHFYPESEMWHMHQGIGMFQHGAFYLAHKANCPVVPLVHLFKPRKVLGVQISKNLLNVTTVIGEPIFPDNPCNISNSQVDLESVKIMVENAHAWMVNEMAAYKAQNNIC